MSRIHEATEKIVEGYEKIENGVVTGYQKVEDTVVGGFTKVADQFVGTFLTRDGESVEEAKDRLAAQQEQRRVEAGKREADRKARLEASRNAGKRN